MDACAVCSQPGKADLFQAAARVLLVTEGVGLPFHPINQTPEMDEAEALVSPGLFQAMTPHEPCLVQVVVWELPEAETSHGYCQNHFKMQR